MEIFNERSCERDSQIACVRPSLTELILFRLMMTSSPSIVIFKL